jgi:DGQHR domain-containing protein
MPGERARRSVSLVTQGKNRFYTLTIFSNELAETTFVTTRYEDPLEGFQRTLDKDRAKQIASYIDSGGSIPNSIVLSAQKSAEFKVVGRGKTVEFTLDPKAFLILDGQHRVFGFRLAKTKLRVPVVIYNGLSRKEEARLFIDINTKQRPVPNELLLDIKKLAEYEDDQERLLGGLFDEFNTDNTSPLLGLMSPAERASGKISRVTFNNALKPILSTLQSKTDEEIYQALKHYVAAVVAGLERKKHKDTIVKPVVFRAFLAIFPDVGRLVQDKYGAEYNFGNFESVLSALFDQTAPKHYKEPGNSVNALTETLSKNLKRKFAL